jgi:hypothetical protein
MSSRALLSHVDARRVAPKAQRIVEQLNSRDGLNVPIARTVEVRQGRWAPLPPLGRRTQLPSFRDRGSIRCVNRLG